MKKIFLLAFLFLLSLNMFELNPKADSADYLTYQEIILSSGKIIKNWTSDEIEAILDGTDWHFWGIYVTLENQNVQGSYIAAVKECMENTSDSTITIDVSYSVETNTKVSFSSSGSISAAGSGKLGSIKAECSAKASVEYSDVTTTSAKETRKINISVEGNSQYMVVTKGMLTVTNGVVECFELFIRTAYGCFELVTLQSQYAVLEKRSL